jgi:HSP20 family protein
MRSRHTVSRGWPDMLRDMRRTQDQINRLFEGMRLPALEYPPVNVWVSPEGAVMTAAMAGAKPDQVDIMVHQNTVTLRGDREPETQGEGEVIVHRQERVLGPFSRTVILPFRVDADRVDARFERGVLTLKLPRPAADQPRRIKIATADTGATQ